MVPDEGEELVVEGVEVEGVVLVGLACWLQELTNAAEIKEAPISPQVSLINSRLVSFIGTP